MKLLYMDCTNSGLSGDMFLAGLVGLIEDPMILLNELKTLDSYLSGISNLELNLGKIKRSGLLINQLKINLKETKQHRSSKILNEALNKFLNEKEYSDLAKNYAHNVLNTLIRAEAEVHGKLAENIHLHELSSVDTLIDILGVTRALDLIGTFNKEFKIYCSKLPLGGGTITAAHGMLPVPAPATLKILESTNLTVYNGPIEKELVTPTGAALLVNLNPIVSSKEMKLEKIVYSTGEKEFENFLNVLRIFYGEAQEEVKLADNYELQTYLEKVAILETDVDDVSGEILGNFIKKFDNEKILDLKVFNGITKKNRPSQTIRIMCHPENRFELIEKILEELGTLGVRINIMDRVCIDRQIITEKIEINSKAYEIRFKMGFYNKGERKYVINIKPEYEDLRRISEGSGLPIIKVQSIAQSLLKKLYKEQNQKPV